MYRIPEMPRPGSAFAQSFIQGLQLGGLFRQAQEQKEERDEERKARHEQNAWKLATTMAKTDPKLANTFLEKQLGIKGAFEIPMIEVGGVPEKRERETIPAEMPGVPEIDQETIIPGAPGQEFPVSREQRVFWQLGKAAGIPEERLTQKMLGFQYPQLEQKIKWLEKVQPLSKDDPFRLGVEKIIGASVERGEAPEVIEVGVGKAQMQKRKWDRKNQRFVPIGKPYSKFAPKGVSIKTDLGKEQLAVKREIDEITQRILKVSDLQFMMMNPTERKAYIERIGSADILERIKNPKQKARLKHLYQRLSEITNKLAGTQPILTDEVAMEYLDKAGGDPTLAREMAIADGWIIPD